MNFSQTYRWWPLAWLAAALVLLVGGWRGPVGAPPAFSTPYPWPRAEKTYQSLEQRFPAPPGYLRVKVAPGSWGEWLRRLPMRALGTPVRSRLGIVLTPGDSPNLAGVVDLDVRAAQQCADTILRLRAEYLWQVGRTQEIAFHATEGSLLRWTDWQQGVRPVRLGSKLVFTRRARPDASRACFYHYLDRVMGWGGTLSLARETAPVGAAEPQVGDFLVYGGRPGHAVLLADLVRDQAGRYQALLVEGRIPSQSAHVLAPRGGGAWIPLDRRQGVVVPLYGRFAWGQLHRFTPSKS